MLVLEIYNLITPFIKSRKKLRIIRKAMENAYDKQTHCYICKSKIAVYSAENERGLICPKCFIKEEQ